MCLCCINAVYTYMYLLIEISLFANTILFSMRTLWLLEIRLCDLVLIMQELEKGVVKLLIQTPNARNKCGFNTDRYVFDPSCTSSRDNKHLKFLGVLFGVAMRTKKPLDLHLAQPMWKLLAGITLTTEDLEEVGIECVVMGL